MGQAKQRGTAAERAEQAREQRRDRLKAISVDELRATHELPTEAEFIGFVVWIQDRDEFLVQFDDTPAVTKRVYGSVVESAVRFPSWDAAASHAAASKYPAIVGAAFDMGKQIAVIGG